MASEAQRQSGWLCGSDPSSDIAGQIRQRIADGDLKPGDFLGTESSLSQAFSVNRIILRDALQILEASGIISVTVGKAGGVRVAEPNPDRFADALAVQLKLAGITEREIFDAQMGAEMRAVELAVEQASAQDIVALEAQYERCLAAVGDREGFARESLNFHWQMIKASHNRALLAHAQALQRVSSNVLMRRSTLHCAQRVLERYGKTLAAVRARDLAAAAAVRAYFHIPGATQAL